jgi:hypothetical protein
MSNEERIVLKQLGRKRVRDVRVVEDVNDDGEDILRIVVIYESKEDGLSVQEMSEITNEIWSARLRGGDPSFPVTSFISSDDEGVLHPA